jgi:hypothetical protein
MVWDGFYFVRVLFHMKNNGLSWGDYYSFVLWMGYKFKRWLLTFL